VDTWVIMGEKEIAMKNPCAILRAENAAIRSILEVLEEICFLLRADQEILQIDLVKIADFLERYCEIFHNEKEMHYLYPAMAAAGLFDSKPELLELADEHDIGRAFIEELKLVTAGNEFNSDDFIMHAEAYIEHMRLHIDAEETLLFPLVEKDLPDKDQAAVIQAFEQWKAGKDKGGQALDFDRLIQYFQQKYLRNR